jgi:hypothetical protein
MNTTLTKMDTAPSQVERSRQGQSLLKLPFVSYPCHVRHVVPVCYMESRVMRLRRKAIGSCLAPASKSVGMYCTETQRVFVQNQEILDVLDGELELWKCTLADAETKRAPRKTGCQVTEARDRCSPQIFQSLAPSNHASTNGPAPSIPTPASLHRCSNPSRLITSPLSASAYVSKSELESVCACEYDGTFVVCGRAHGGSGASVVMAMAVVF